MLKILQARLQQYMNQELPDVQSGFIKSRGTRYQFANKHWIIEKAREFQKNIYFCFIMIMAKPLTVWITVSCGKLLETWEYQTTLLASCEIYIQVKKQQLALDIEQWTNSKLEKQYIKAVYCHPAYLTHVMQNAGLDEAQAGIKTEGRNINNLRYADDTHLW